MRGGERKGETDRQTDGQIIRSQDKRYGTKPGWESRLNDFQSPINLSFLILKRGGGKVCGPGENFPVSPSIM